MRGQLVGVARELPAGSVGQGRGLLGTLSLSRQLDTPAGHPSVPAADEQQVCPRTQPTPGVGGGL